MKRNDNIGICVKHLLISYRSRCFSKRFPIGGVRFNSHTKFYSAVLCETIGAARFALHDCQRTI